MTQAPSKGRKLIVAMFATLGLLLQAAVGMSPAMAMGSGGQTIEICTGHGTKTITVDQAGQPAPGKQTPCPHCDQCLGPALALTGSDVRLVQPVRYAVRAETATSVSLRLPPARAPPRPPGQGPPDLLTV